VSAADEPRRPGFASFLDAANAVSLLGLCAALAAALLATRGRIALAVVALSAAGLCDLLDGLVARRLPRDDLGRTFGGRLDSLVDACAFGLAPCLLFQAAGLRRPLEVALLGVFLCCAVWRLAYFDTLGIEEDAAGRRAYRGVPTTFTSLVVALAFLSGLAGAPALRAAAAATALGLAVGMVAPVRFPKPGTVGSAVLGVIGLALLAVWVALSRAPFPA